VSDDRDGGREREGWKGREREGGMKEGERKGGMEGGGGRNIKNTDRQTETDTDRILNMIRLVK